MCIFLVGGLDRYRPSKIDAKYGSLEKEKDSSLFEKQLSKLSVKERSPEELMAETIKIYDKVHKESMTRYKRVYFLGLTSALILALMVTNFAATEFACLQLNSSFDQRLTVLAPKISDQEYEEFRALWAGMKSRKDYKIIENKMNNSANKYGIQLPTPLLP